MKNLEPVDDYTLAAFLAGTLPEERREAVAAYLAENPEARRTLCMAFEAYEASGLAGFAETQAEPLRASAKRPAHTADRQAVRPAHRAWQKTARYLAAACLVVALGAGLRAALVPSTDVLRNTTLMTAPALEVQVAPRSLSFRWNALPDAAHYRLVVYDQEGTVLAQHRTSATRIDADDDFIRSLRPLLHPGEVYAVRVAAYDVQNRQVQHSDLIDFSRP